MACRYKLARAMGKQAFEEALQEDTILLSSFGLQLLSVDSGVRAALEKEVKNERVNPWNVLGIDSKTWGWLRPLLKELSQHRQEAAPQTAHLDHSLGHPTAAALVP